MERNFADGFNSSDDIAHFAVERELIPKPAIQSARQSSSAWKYLAPTNYRLKIPTEEAVPYEVYHPSPAAVPSHSDDASLLRFLHAQFQLTLVIRTVEVALRLGNKSVISDLPFLEPAEANPIPSPARPGVGAGECPMVFCPVALNQDVVHG